MLEDQDISFFSLYLDKNRSRNKFYRVAFVISFFFFFFCHILKAELQFVADSAEFTDTFQRDEPLIHLLFVELRNLKVVLSGRILVLNQWLRGYMLKYLIIRQI